MFFCVSVRVTAEHHIIICFARLIELNGGRGEILILFLLAEPAYAAVVP